MYVGSPLIPSYYSQDALVSLVHCNSAGCCLHIPECSRVWILLTGRHSYFSSWFHIFDAVVILASFAIDLVAHGVAEDIASLVVVLRLWRFVKVVEEVSLGAAERMEELEAQIEKLTEENRVMGVRLAQDRSGSRGS